jgi:hypothetical protein
MEGQRVDREGGMNDHFWFAVIGLLGLVVMLGGACGMFVSRDGAAIAGGVVVGSIAISIAILVAAKK